MILSLLHAQWKHWHHHCCHTIKSTACFQGVAMCLMMYSLCSFLATCSVLICKPIKGQRREPMREQASSVAWLLLVFVGDLLPRQATINESTTGSTVIHEKHFKSQKQNHKVMRLRWGHLLCKMSIFFNAYCSLWWFWQKEALHFSIFESITPLTD